MKKIVYSPDYKEKLLELRRYLDFQFGADVRVRVLKELNTRIRMLQDHENSGISVREVYGIDCDYRCLYAVHNYVFYKADKKQIYIVNMYHEQEDFMKKMFGIETTIKEAEDYWNA